MGKLFSYAVSRRESLRAEIGGARHVCNDGSGTSTGDCERCQLEAELKVVEDAIASAKIGYGPEDDWPNLGVNMPAGAAWCVPAPPACDVTTKMVQDMVDRGFILVDDSHDSKRPASPEELERLRAWWRDTIGTRRVYAKSRTNDADLVGQLLDPKAGDFAHLTLPAYEPPKTP